MAYWKKTKKSVIQIVLTQFRPTSTHQLTYFLIQIEFWNILNVEWSKNMLEDLTEKSKQPEFGIKNSGSWEFAYNSPL